MKKIAEVIKEGLNVALNEAEIVGLDVNVAKRVNMQSGFLESKKNAKATLMQNLYGNVASAKRKRTKYITVPVRSANGQVVDSFEVTSKEVKGILALFSSDGKHLDATDSETGEFLNQSDEDVEEIVVADQAQKAWNKEYENRKAEIDAMFPVDRYKAGLYNKGNRSRRAWEEKGELYH